MKFKQYVKHNAPSILTGLGVLGVVGTTITAVHATPKAIKLIQEENKKKLSETGSTLDILEKVIIVTPIYLPSILLGIGTITCILGANHINKERQALLTSAYAYLNTSFNEYKTKVNELYGEGASDRVEQIIAQERLAEYDRIYLVDRKLFYDKISKRYFESTIFDLQAAIYRLNEIYAVEGEVSINQFYKLLDLEPTEYGDAIGWNGINQWEFVGYAWINIDWKKMDMPDDLECYALDYQISPMEGFAFY